MLKVKADYNKYMREYLLKRYYKRKQAYILEMGGRCTSCSTEEDLHFHHKDRTEKRFTIAKMWSYSEKLLREELKKCILLCQDCHRKEHTTWEHGTAAMYKRCRCSICKLGNNKRSKEYRQRVRNSVA